MNGSSLRMACEEISSYKNISLKLNSLENFDQMTVLASLYDDESIDKVDLLLEGSFNIADGLKKLLRNEIKPIEFKKEVVKSLISDYQEKIDDIFQDIYQNDFMEVEGDEYC